MKSVSEKIVVLGADHNGVSLKKSVKEALTAKGYVCIDIGSFGEDEKVDYVDYAKTLSHIINNGEAGKGILMCGTGVGMSIVANRLPNVRASLVHSVDVAGKTREHNDANVLCLGAWVNSLDDNLEMVSTWFNEPFGEGRHVKRVEKTKQHDKSRVVMTNGIFDILHTGHIDLLRFAKSQGGKLVVAINSDRTAEVLKGKDRPVNNEEDRKKVLEGLGFIDQVIIFDDIDTVSLVRELMPDVVVKGAEWSAAEVRKRDSVPQEIDVVVFPLLLEKSSGVKYSTTQIINKIQGNGVSK